MDKLISFFNEKLPLIENYLAKLVDSINPVVKPVAKHIVLAGGKRLRPFLCILTARALGYKNEEEILPLACAIEIIHSATLLHDDIIDNADNRRGKKAAHLIFGITETILAGDALLALANKIVTDYYNNVSLVSCISEAIHKTAAGEILEIQKMREPYLSKEDYFEIIKGKTAYLIQSCCQGGAILANCESSLEEAAKNFGFNIGIAFQLIDDALDYRVNLDLGKPKGGDLKEGKITLPLIFYLEQMEHNKKVELISKIKTHRLTEEEKFFIIYEIQKRGILNLVKKEAELYLNQAKKHLDLFPLTSEKELLFDVIEFIKNRKK